MNDFRGLEPIYNTIQQHLFFLCQGTEEKRQERLQDMRTWLTMRRERLLPTPPITTDPAVLFGYQFRKEFFDFISDYLNGIEIPRTPPPSPDTSPCHDENENDGRDMDEEYLEGVSGQANVQDPEEEEEEEQNEDETSSETVKTDGEDAIDTEDVDVLSRYLVTSPFSSSSSPSSSSSFIVSPLDDDHPI